MYAMQFGGIEVPAFSQRDAAEMSGSSSGFPTAEERRARRAERLAEIRFRCEKGYPLSLADRLRALWL